ncbi:efflux RND transporter permease subunit [Marinicauda algicola]|uniref:Efflux RND transporter permease subunit n=1 Tax=Marinicauda algicola TaxID=2029849 RepID=A0A4S2H4E6_9PROT|nr:efflux RND transporter permease subunit [Marinicauda algicola]TGY90403.1 efflux RND transporter permease subunit [Marinicauda algicola]
MDDDQHKGRPRSISGNPGFPGAGLIGWFVRNPVAANLLMLLFLLGGAFTAATMRTEVFPTLSPDVIQVAVIYPGATPEEVEESITRRIEEAVLGLEGVDRVRSVASEGRGTVTVELLDFADTQTVKDDVETAVDSLLDFPPEDAEEPQVRVPQPSTTILTLALTGPVTERALREAGEQAERELLSRGDVTSVRLRGVRSYEISIDVSEEDLRRYALSFDEVAATVRASSIDLSGGEMRTQGGEILLRTDARRETGAQFAEIILRSNPDGTRVRLGDVAEISDGFQDEPLISLFDGEPAVFVDVITQGNEDLLAVRAATMAWLQETSLPPGVHAEVSTDESDVFVDRISLLARNAILGFTLVFLLLVLMLDLRLAFWVAMGVPISFLGGFALFGTVGVTLNFITTFGLIVVLGIVVDDAIVVGENTDREMSKGLADDKAAVAGVTGVAAPVLVGVLTTMAAFGPLIFSGGEFGEIVRPIPIVVICILAVSLVEAFLILPAHLSHGGNWSRGPLARLQDAVAAGLARFSDGPLYSWARFAGRMRYLVAAAGIAIIVGVFSLVATGVVRFVFFPSIEAEDITADLRLPDGAPFEATERATRQLVAAAESLAAEYEEQGQPIIRSIATVIGGRTSLFGGPGTTQNTIVASNLAQLRVQLVPAAERTISSSEIERLWRERAGRLPGVEQLTIVSSAGPQDADIAYEMSHPDDATLERAAARLAEEVALIEGVQEIDDGFDLGKRQLNFTLTPAGEAAGLRPADIARQVRQSFFGEEVQRFQRGSDEVKVYVRYPEAQRNDLARLGQFRVRTPDGGAIPLSVAAVVTETRGYTEIERVDGRRIIELTADVDEAVITPGNARERVEAEILPQLVQDFPRLDWRLAGAGREQQEDFASLQRGLMVAVLIMYALLATQLRSYIQPVVILIAVPFGAAGAVLGHLLLGYDLSFPSIFGVVALSGVVVNASIVLIDRYNQNLGLEMDFPEAIAEATARRFRPVLITTLTTALGLLPIITETSPQAQFLIPMAVSLGAGLLFAATLILSMLPAFVLIVEDIRGRSRARDVAVRAYGGEIEPRESGETDAARSGRTGPSG